MEAILFLYILICIAVLAISIWMIVKFFILCSDVKKLIESNKLMSDWNELLQNKVDKLSKQIEEFEDN